MASSSVVHTCVEVTWPICFLCRVHPRLEPSGALTALQRYGQGLFKQWHHQPIAQKCKNMALSSLRFRHLFTIRELKQESPATSSVTSTEGHCFHCFYVFFFVFREHVVSSLELWFLPDWKICSIISLTTFDPSALLYFGSSVTHVFVPSLQCTLCSHISVSLWNCFW